MEPLSALTIACAVVQFVDFSGTLISKIIQIYESTSCLPASDTSDVDEISRDLDTLHKEIMSKSQGAKTGSEDVFIRHCKSCLEIGKELQDCVKEASVVRHDNVLRRILSSAHLASRQRRIKEKLDAIRARLDRVQTQMATAVLVHMWAVSKEPNQVAEKSNLSSHVPALNSLAHLQQSGNNSISPGQASPNLHIPQSVMIDAMWAMITLEPNFFEGYQPQPALGIPWVKARAAELGRTFLAHRLFYEKLGHRGGSIPTAHAQTFGWIFETPRLNASGGLEWSSFSNWLQGTPDPGEVYWVTGKPGAGKSTLMKFIIEHKRTRELLGRWSGDRSLLLLDFYFWAAGSDLQRSREGLLRTVLFQAVRNQPDLVPLLFPKRWTLAVLFGPDALDRLELSLEELVNAFWIFLHRYTTKGKVAVFIDGLDEFQGDHRLLVELVNKVANTPNVKVCVSSRPWNTFRDVFSRGPSLMVELLTRDDIERYVRDRFSASEGFRELGVLNSSGATKLITDVVDKAQGVFLWVRVVVNSLLLGLAQGDSLRQLQDELNKLPEELSQLFDFIWQTLDPQHQIEAHRYFLMLRAATDMSMSLNALSVWLSDDAYDIDMDNPSLSNVDVSTALKALTRRLSSRTKGLIEIQRPPGSRSQRIELSIVGYMHRSVMDWVSPQDSLPGSAPSLTPGSAVFDPALWLLKGETLRLARCAICADFGVSKRNSQGLKRFGDLIEHLFYIASCILDDPGNLKVCMSVMDRLDQELTRISGIQPARSGNKAGYDVLGVFWVTNKTPHWSNILTIPQSSRQVQDSDAVMITNYLGFLSQIPVIPYVRTKVLADPSLLGGALFSNRTPSPVIALLGFQRSLLQRLVDRWHNSQELQDRRLELLRIFLASDQINIKLLEQRMSTTILPSRDLSITPEWRATVLGLIREFKRPTTSERISRALKLTREN